MRACYVNHHIVSRGRALRLATAAQSVRVGEQRVASATASRCTIKDDISRPIYITREKERGERALHFYTPGYYTYVYVCAPEGWLRAPRLDIRPREIIRANDAAALSSKRPDGRGALYWYPIWRRSPGFRR